ncbi:MAG: Gfo/Idh/MocA family oxidoreductase [Bryobacteraceae bacterium]|nr:Gfo/Idh/MocA family oxidoreductase [Bryobacteraceae bacterium]
MPATRRSLLGGIAASSYLSIQGANDAVRIGLIGCGGRGLYVSGFMAKVPGVAIAAVCDVHTALAEKAKARAGSGCSAYQDFRKLLEQRDLDAVVVATPDHWHAIATIRALEAGKAVYVEKPLAHNVREGRAMLEAARRTRKLALPGTQHRSAAHYAEAARRIAAGEIGEVRLVRVWNFSNMLPNGIGRAPDSAPPPELDWDLYLGPAPMRPYNPRRHGPTYRWFTDYAGGTITDFGVHRFDTVHQIMGEKSPLSVSAAGGRFALNDMGEMPDTMTVTYQYPGYAMVYEMSNINGFGSGGRQPGVRYYNARTTQDRPHGEAYYGTKGTILADRIGYEVYMEGESKPPLRVDAADATSLHAAHFIACIRGLEQPRSDLERAHRATNVAHLGNIAYLTGRRIQWNEKEESIPGDREADALLGRTPRKPWTLA